MLLPIFLDSQGKVRVDLYNENGSAQYKYYYPMPEDSKYKINIFGMPTQFLDKRITFIFGRDKCMKVKFLG